MIVLTRSFSDGLSENKNGQIEKFSHLSAWVAPAGIVNLLQQLDVQLKTEAKKIKLT
ncbi:MAG: hypothetical protein ACOYXT_17385 [Bacteroidota bacterium]